MITIQLFADDAIIYRQINTPHDGQLGPPPRGSRMSAALEKRLGYGFLPPEMPEARSHEKENTGYCQLKHQRALFSNVYHHHSIASSLFPMIFHGKITYSQSPPQQKNIVPAAT